MYKRIVLFLMFFVATASAVLSQNSYHFKHLTSIEGLSNNTVHNIVQDHDGYVWLATIEGLNRFNGTSIKSYYSNEKVGDISSNIVTRLIVNSSGELFIGTINGLDIYNRNTDSFEPILFENNRLNKIMKIVEMSNKDIIIATLDYTYKLTPSKIITKINETFYRDISEYQDDKIWGITGDEIQLIDSNGEIIKRYNNTTHFGSIDFSSQNVECVFRDSRGIIWLGTKRNGLAYYDALIDKFYNLRIDEGVNEIEDNFIRIISEGYNNDLWIGTESGIYTYNVANQKFKFHTQNLNPLESGLNDKAIYDIYKGSDNTMWIGTFFGGVNYTNPNTKIFSNIYADGGDKNLSGKAVSNIIEAKDGKIWIATEDGGISILDRNNNKFEYLKHSTKTNSLTSNNIHALEEDSEGNVWIGTFLGGINKYNSNTKQISSVKVNQLDNKNLLSVFSIFNDSKNRIWAGSLFGLFRNDGEVFNPIYSDFFTNKFIRFINEDKDGNIWICTNFSGIYKIDSNENISNYSNKNREDITSEFFTYSFIDSKQNIWFGTQGGGLVNYNISLDKFTTYTTNNGLPNNTVHTVTEDEDGNIWFSTNKGIVRFNVKTDVFKGFNENDGLIGNQFNYNSCLNTKDNTLFFGAVNGLSYFNSENIRTIEQETNLIFTDFKLFNKTISATDDGILTSHINSQDEVNLNYDDNVFTIDYVGINYQSPKKIKYAFMLDGFESEWNYVGDKTSATYTNLSSGNYVFKIKTTDGNGIWSDNIRTINISVEPPFWLSPWGYLLYFVIGAVFTFLFYKVMQIRNSEKMKIQIANIEKQNTIEINKHRLNFFTYISHEFKTPLSIVLATIEELIQEESNSNKMNKYGDVIKKNALKLLFLINQLMDFRKIETDHASIKLNNGDIIKFLYSIVDSFKPLFKKKAITVNITSDVDSYETYFDAEKTEKIVSNIISNSYKALAEDSYNGEINIDIHIKTLNEIGLLSNKLSSESIIDISISDNGPGMTKEKLSKLFDPFYSENKNSNFSSGIGLALVSSLLKLLDGKITATSKIDHGTEFEITIPLIINPPKEYILSSSFVKEKSGVNIETTILDLEYANSTDDELDTIENTMNHDILIVEDNKDLSNFLSNHFSKTYKTNVAFDGKEAIAKINKSHPDIILSDVMMPNMDGNEMCDILKGSIETSHIPIILLTANSGIESKIEGLSKGADAYMKKPFNLQELDLQVRNILKSIEDNKKKFSQFESLDDSIDHLQNKEAKFIGDLTKIILDNLEDNNFSINDLCEKLFISRTQLHRKLKKITGLSTSEYIRNVKLNEGKKLLLTHKYTISEVANKVGYTDSAYFSKSFKKVFNELPSSYMKDTL